MQIDQVNVMVQTDLAQLAQPLLNLVYVFKAISRNELHPKWQHPLLTFFRANGSLWLMATHGDMLPRVTNVSGGHEKRVLPAGTRVLVVPK